MSEVKASQFTMSHVFLTLRRSATTRSAYRKRRQFAPNQRAAPGGKQSIATIKPAAAVARSMNIMFSLSAQPSLAIEPIIGIPDLTCRSLQKFFWLGRSERSSRLVSVSLKMVLTGLIKIDLREDRSFSEGIHCAAYQSGSCANSCSGLSPAGSRSSARAVNPK